MRRFTLIMLVSLLLLVIAAGVLSYWIGTHRHLRPGQRGTPTVSSS